MDDKKAGAGAVIGIVLVLALVISFFKGGSNDPPPSSNPPRYYDPNSTSEENRRMVRDQMIKQGVKPDEADVFTRELYKAEREHRRKHGLPE